MSDAPPQLKLTPQERRVVMAIGLTVVLVLNYLFVWPHFGEWKSTRRQLNDMYGKIEQYQKEVNRDLDPTNGYKKQLAKLIRQEGAGVMDKQVQLQTTVQSTARKCQVDLDKIQSVGSRAATNEFFDEEAIQIQVQSQEPQLIKFLFSIGNDPSMIRVIELSLKPMESTRYHLGGAITLAANYKKSAPLPAAPAAKPKTPGPKPAQAGGPPAPGARPPNLPAKPPSPGQKGPSAPKPKPSPNPNPKMPPGRNPARQNL